MAVCPILSRHDSRSVKWIPRDGGVQNSQPRLLWSLNLDHMSRDETVAYGISARKVQERFRFGVRQEDYETVSLYTKVKLHERLAIVLVGIMCSTILSNE